jgi:hypothetical protein
MAFESLKRHAPGSASILGFLVYALPFAVAGVWGNFSDERIPVWLQGRGYPSVTKILIGWAIFSFVVSLFTYIVLTALSDASGDQTYPAVDFDLLPKEDANESESKLLLVIHNRGACPITDIRMRATRYRLQPKTIVPPKIEPLPEGKFKFTRGKFELVVDHVEKLGFDSLEIKKLKPNRKGKAIDLLQTGGLHFTKPPLPGEPGGAGGPPTTGHPAEFYYYGLRFTFIDTSSRNRFAHYKIVLCEPPYVPYVEHPSMGLSLPGEVENDFMLFAPLELIRKHQRMLYSSYSEEEYPKIS